MNEKKLDHKKILDKIREAYKENYNSADTDIVESVLRDVMDLFSGKIKGFQKCDTKYHDLTHTFQVIPPFIGIIDGLNKSENTRRIPKDFFDLGLVAVLLHDTGYIKTEDDVAGTGGKYTFVHIQRSADFADHYLSRKGYERHKISSVRNIIMCTGVKVDFDKLPFRSEEERVVGYTLGTADLLGQMSASDYLEKLHALYSEFEEAYHYEGMERLKETGMIIFTSADDLVRNTPSFYEIVVKERFEKMGSVYKHLPRHFNDTRNYYIEAIEENIRKIKAHVSSSVNQP